MEERNNGLWLGDYAYLLAVFRGDSASQTKGWIDKATAYVDELKKIRSGFVQLEHFAAEQHKEVVVGTQGDSSG